MKFTKLLALAMALLLLAATMVACGGGNDTTAPDTTKAPDAPETTEAPAPETNPPETTEHVHNHKIKSSETVKPTCTEAGSKTYVCDCGDTKVEPTEATGHSYKSTDDTTGKYTKHVCSACDDTYYTAVGSETKLDKAPDGIQFIDYALNIDFTDPAVLSNSQIMRAKSNSSAFQLHEVDPTTQNAYYSMKYNGTDSWWDGVVAKDAVAAKYIISLDMNLSANVPTSVHLLKIRGQNAEGKAVFQHLLFIDKDGDLCRFDYTGTHAPVLKADGTECTFADEMYAWGYPTVKITKMKLGEWQNVAVIIDDNDADFDVYVDGVCVAKDCPMLYTTATTECLWPGINNGSARVRFAQIIEDAATKEAAQTVAVLNCDNAQLCTYVKGILD